MPKNPKVSVLVASFNAGIYIKNTIASVLNQTYGDFELLIIDNASTDHTVEHIREFTDPRIRLFEHPENLGPYGGLNFLLERSTGEYIAIQDHDDLWHPDKLSLQVQYLDSHPEDLGCGCAVVMYYEANETYFEYWLGEMTDYALHPAIVYRKHS